jgi:hypothetical protein
MSPIPRRRYHSDLHTFRPAKIDKQYDVPTSVSAQGVRSAKLEMKSPSWNRSQITKKYNS